MISWCKPGGEIVNQLYKLIWRNEATACTYHKGIVYSPISTGNTVDSYVVILNSILCSHFYIDFFLTNRSFLLFAWTWVVLGEVRVASLFLKDIRDFRYICLGSVSCVECFLYPFFFAPFWFSLTFIYYLWMTKDDKLTLFRQDIVLDWKSAPCHNESEIWNKMHFDIVISEDTLQVTSLNLSSRIITTEKLNMYSNSLYLFFIWSTLSVG